MEYQAAFVEYSDAFIGHPNVLGGILRSPYGIFWECFGHVSGLLFGNALALFWDRQCLKNPRAIFLQCLGHDLAMRVMFRP